ncbi:hypothetical protein 44RRORF017c [Aeromonas phage 44RR2.8t]|uniref:Uncharacterized protein n=2 Tax=Biquartavirus 44RR2 TaxID=115987 RepID=Q6U9T5_9CAUD|nr:hypothetical protein ST44RRORF017c [Aeromonas phage 44RR2.8t]AAQ81336.1 hypothetical protein 44RRORF017c [Aeromonas phage 44RR2.8t]APU00489.1 hypothetical protein [Aeromonas phage 44RR2.8t.2]
MDKQVNEVVVYLDIDGVLNTVSDHEIWRTDRASHLFRTSPYNHGDFVSNHRLSILREWLIRNNAKVVIVSSWVVLNDTGKMICDFLELPYHSEAYNTGGGQGRGTGVLKHAADHGIRRWVVIDDAKCMYDHSEVLLHHLVHIEGGLNESYLEEADFIL